MCVFAVACGRYDPKVVRRASGWTWRYLPSAALFTRLAIRRLHQQRATGRCLLGVVVAGHGADVADLVREPGRDRYHELTDLRP